MTSLLDPSSEVVRTAKQLGEEISRMGTAVEYTAGDSSLSYILAAFITR